MDVYVNLNKHFDTDILALHNAGYAVNTMIGDCLVAFVTHTPFQINIDELVDLDLNNKKSAKIRVTITHHQEEIKKLLDGVKHSLRSNFCKQLLRNYLVQQSLACYFEAGHQTFKEAVAANYESLPEGERVVPGSRYKKYQRTISILNEAVSLEDYKGEKLRKQKKEPTPAPVVSPAPAKRPAPAAVRAVQPAPEPQVEPISEEHVTGKDAPETNNTAKDQDQDYQDKILAMFENM